MEKNSAGQLLCALGRLKGFLLFLLVYLTLAFLSPAGPAFAVSVVAAVVTLLPLGLSVPAETAAEAVRYKYALSALALLTVWPLGCCSCVFFSILSPADAPREISAVALSVSVSTLALAALQPLTLFSRGKRLRLALSVPTLLLILALFGLCRLNFPLATQTSRPGDLIFLLPLSWACLGLSFLFSLRRAKKHGSVHD